MQELKPALRFDGFDDTWEQRKLGELCYVIDTKHATAPVSEEQTQFRMIRTDCVRDGQLLPNNTDSVTEEVYEEWSERVHLQPDDLVFTREAPMGESTVIPDDGYKYFPGQRVVTLRSKGDVDTSFLNYLIYANSFRDEIRVRESASTTVANFGIPSIKAYAGIFPALSEQRRIGGLLASLDNLITLHQREYDKLLMAKQSLLQKMFPKAGETEPELRFEGFEGPWESKKLGDIAEIIGGGTPDTNRPEYWDGDIDWYSPAELGEYIYADSSQRRITKLGYENSSAKMLPAGRTILFTSRAGIGTTAILRRSACTNQGFQSLVLGEDINTYFVYSMSGRIKTYAESRASGSTFLEISAKLLGDMDIWLPSRREQDAIGSCFQQLDNLISLRAQELEKLRQIKSGLLQRMFV